MKKSGVDVMITIFCDFLPIYGEKNGVFSKTNVMIKVLQKSSSSLRKNINIFAKFFGENIFKIITSVPGLFLESGHQRLDHRRLSPLADSLHPSPRK
jgi:hypothetical protein